ncbi:MAG: hypothetical protein AAB347_13215, partial [Bacteroidota bacterium]
WPSSMLKMTSTWLFSIGLIGLGDESNQCNDQKEADRNGDHQTFLRVVQIQIDREQDHGHEGQEELISHYQNIA